MPKTMKGPAIFLAQFAGDAAPFNSLDSITKWAAGLGYKGVQIPTWDGRLFDLKKAATSKTYCDEIKGVLKDQGIVITELSTHLQGQLVAENPINGPIPFFTPPDMTELLSDFEVRQSVPELMQLAQSTTGIYSHFPANIEHTLMQMMREANGVTMRPALRFSTVQVRIIPTKSAR